MGTLTSYKSIEEKQAVFTNCVFCDTEKDIRDWLTGIGEGSLNGVGMAFRGLTRGSYKLYSSLQRSWVEQDLALHQQDHKGIVQRILDEAFEQRVNGTSLVNGGRDELAMLSYLQHHGCPTPFLDFTSDVRVALFFASQEPKGAGNGSELDNYFSIYIIHREIVDAMNSGLAKAWRECGSGHRAEAAQWFRSYEMNALEDTLIFETQWINRNYGGGVVSLDTSDRFRRQAGLFAMNNTADLPFPEAVHAFVDARTNDVREQLSVRTWINSLNIHRNYAGLVKSWLGSQDPPITENYLLPVQENEGWICDIFDRILGSCSSE